MTAQARAGLSADVVQHLITEGVTVVVRPDPALGFVAVNVWHDVGSLHDPPGKSGLAHITEHVLFGSADDTTRPVHRGESANATTAFERTNYVSTGLPEMLPRLLSQAARRLSQGGRHLTAPLLDGHRRVVHEEIRQREDAARFGSGMRRSLRLLFGREHPFGRPPSGTVEELREVTANDVEEFVAEVYGAAPVIVSIVGSVSADRALALAERCFRGLPARRRARGYDPVPPARGGRRREDVQEGQPTGMLRYTFALPSEGERLAVAGETTMALLAGAPWSLLRPETINTYRVLGATAQHVRCGTGSSIGLVKISVAAGVDLDQLDRAMVEQWALLARRGPDQDVLQAAIARRGKEFLATFGRARSCAEELCLQHAWRGSATHTAERLTALHAVDDSEVAEIAASCLAEPVVVAFQAEQSRGTTWIV